MSHSIDIAAVVAIAVLASLGVKAGAQRPDSLDAPDSPHLCWRGHPLPKCGTFLLTEVSGEYAYASTTTHYRYVYTNYVEEYDRADISNRVLWTVGPMLNTGGSRAVGATISAGFTDRGSRLAIEARRRWWTDSCPLVAITRSGDF